MLNSFKNTLSSSEMKNIKGGVVAGGTCGYQKPNGDHLCNVSRATAKDAVVNGGHWCCEHCSTSSYCGVDPWIEPGNGGGGGSQDPLPKLRS